MNNVTLLGRLTSDPIIRYTSGNDPKAVANFFLAIDRIGKNSGADFIPCVAWGKTAEICERYCGKGKQIAVQGRITSDSYEDKEGNRRTKYTVTVERLELLGRADGQEMDKPRSEPNWTRSEGSEMYDPREDFAALDDSDGVPF